MPYPPALTLGASDQGLDQAQVTVSGSRQRGSQTRMGEHRPVVMQRDQDLDIFTGRDWTEFQESLELLDIISTTKTTRVSINIALVFIVII